MHGCARIPQREDNNPCARRLLRGCPHQIETNTRHGLLRRLTLSLLFQRTHPSAHG
eukprot:XP_001703924.1 Hypothetical protein GL50803_99637 [Giardia lamblia ATCC 50803]